MIIREVHFYMGSRSLGYGISLGCLVLASSALAQQVPDAGSVLRQQEQEQQRLPKLPKPMDPLVNRSLTDSEVATNAEAKLSVKAFHFTGNERFSEAELQRVVANYLGRPLSLRDLDGVGAAVVQYYRHAGWLARVIVPPQRIENGVVNLEVIEAVFGEARFSSDTDTKSLRVGPGQLVGRVQARQHKNDKVHIPSIERGLLLANDMPGVSVEGSQVAGSGEGATDILLRAANDPLFFGQVILDNQGARGTGIKRVGVQFLLNSPLGIGDQFNFQGQVTNHQQFGQISGSVPLGNDGLRLSGHFSALHYAVGLPEFRALDARGHSLQFGADLLYPIVRQNDRNLFMGIAFEQKLPFNRVVTGVVSDYKITNAELRINANMFDRLGGGTGITTFNLTGLYGQLDLDGSPNQMADAVTVNTQGNFQVLRYRVSREQNFNAGVSLFAAFGGQFASKNLDSAEKIYLGGPNGVRAYPVNEGGGAEGQMLNVELRWLPPATIGCKCRVSLFYDWGHIKQYKNARFAGASEPNSYALSGLGIGVEAEMPWQTHLSASVARRIGSNPNMTFTGQDQDGSLNKVRFWMSISKTL